MISLKRWLLFLFVGLPIHWALMPIYILVYLFWRAFWLFDKKKQKVSYDHESATVSIYDSEKEILLNSDNHNMLTQWTVATEKSFASFVHDKGHGLTFMRVPNPHSPKAFDEVSGDCVVAFCFAAVNLSRGYPKDLVHQLAKTYLLHLGCPSYDKKNNGTVSSRCNNFGVNWCPDGWGGLGQPAFGPQYFTSSALFALASRTSFWWKVVYHLHRIIMGGFIFEWMPLVVPKNSLFYVRDITAKAIFVHEKVFGLKLWMRKAYDEISRSTERKNPVLCALACRRDYDYSTIPNYVHRFFGQNSTGLSEFDDSSIPQVRPRLISWSIRHERMGVFD